MNLVPLVRFSGRDFRAVCTDKPECDFPGYVADAGGVEGVVADGGEFHFSHNFD